MITAIREAVYAKSARLRLGSNSTTERLLGVKMRRTQREQFESAIPHFSDPGRASGYFAEGPTHKVAALQPAAREQEPRWR
jgi:hypothetical protein